MSLLCDEGRRLEGEEERRVVLEGGGKRGGMLMLRVLLLLLMVSRECWLNVRRVRNGEQDVW